MLDRFDRALSQVQGEIRMLGAVTPTNVRTERQRLLASFRGGTPVMPQWTYSPKSFSELRRRLDHVARYVEHRLEGDIAPLYAARAREMSAEAAIAESAGLPHFASRVAERFAPYDCTGKHHAHALASRWLADPIPTDAAPMTMTDTADPRSLLTRLRSEVARNGLSMRVDVSDSLGALAATGDGVIYVASGRPVSHEDVERTVLHEIAGHALPRIRARSLSPGIFALGTAGGADDQEGLALVFEQRHGFLNAHRRRELAARHVAIRWMLDGANFIDVVRRLNDEVVDLARALIIAERAFRGSNGETPGLGRERVYIGCFERVRTHLESHPSDEFVLSRGQVSVDAIAPLLPLVRSQQAAARTGSWS